MEFFFFPAFIRHFRGYRRLRIAFATFMAAGVGNMLFHFIRDIHYVAQLGLIKAIVGFQTYVFYAVLLAAGIAASQLRSGNRRPRGNRVRDALLPCFGVWAFFCFLQIFAEEKRDSSLRDHFNFFFHLFGLC